MLTGASWCKDYSASLTRSMSMPLLEQRAALGQPLPTLPLGLRGNLVIPVDFEASYVKACQRKRLTTS
jgi:hypothetical protein